MTGVVHRAGERTYEGLWGFVARYMRVPREAPSLPVRTDDRMDSFRPAEGFLRYLKLWFWIVCLIVDIALFVLLVVLWVVEWWVGLILTPVILVIMIVPDVIAYLAVHFRYDTTWYVMTDRSMRLRRGIWVIHETTITYENIQNVKVTQGPVQRYFGIANIVVETAGGGGVAGGHQHGTITNQGRIEGVANAHELRDMILAKMRESKTTGLGDEVEGAATPGRAGWTPAHLEALREIRAEIRALVA